MTGSKEVVVSERWLRSVSLEGWIFLKHKNETLSLAVPGVWCMWRAGLSL